MTEFATARSASLPDATRQTRNGALPPSAFFSTHPHRRTRQHRQSVALLRAEVAVDGRHFRAQQRAPCRPEIDNNDPTVRGGDGERRAADVDCRGQSAVSRPDLVSAQQSARRPRRRCMTGTTCGAFRTRYALRRAPGTQAVTGTDASERKCVASPVRGKAITCSAVRSELFGHRRLKRGQGRGHAPRPVSCARCRSRRLRSLGLGHRLLSLTTNPRCGRGPGGVCRVALCVPPRHDS